MARIAILQRSGTAIENSVEECHKLSVRNIAAQYFVDAVTHPRGTFRLPRKCSDRGLHVCHQKRGRDSFSDHIRNAHGDFVVAESKHIVVIAADGSRWLHAPATSKPGS